MVWTHHTEICGAKLNGQTQVVFPHVVAKTAAARVTVLWSESSSVLLESVHVICSTHSQPTCQQNVHLRGLNQSKCIRQTSLDKENRVNGGIFAHWHLFHGCTA